MGLWQDIHTNFDYMMATEITGSVSHSFAEAKGTYDLLKRSSIPTSTWDGAYILKMNGMESPMESVNKCVDLIYNVTLQLGFELNLQDSVNSLDAMMQDVEEIIMRRLNVVTFHSVMINVIHESTSPVQFAARPDSENWAVVDINFTVIGRRTYT